MAQKNKIGIIWQEQNHEEELKRASNGKISGKSGMKRRLDLHKKIVQNSEFVKRILKHFKDS